MNIRPVLRDVTKEEPAAAPAPARPPRVIQIAPAPGAEGKLIRALQEAISAYSRDELPTPRERAAIRDRLHGAVDIYLTNKLSEAGRDRDRGGRKLPVQ